MLKFGGHSPEDPPSWFRDPGPGHRPAFAGSSTAQRSSPAGLRFWLWRWPCSPPLLCCSSRVAAPRTWAHSYCGLAYGVKVPPHPPCSCLAVSPLVERGMPARPCQPAGARPPVPCVQPGGGASVLLCCWAGHSVSHAAPLAGEVGWGAKKRGPPVFPGGGGGSPFFKNLCWGLSIFPPGLPSMGGIRSSRGALVWQFHRQPAPCIQVAPARSFLALIGDRHGAPLSCCVAAASALLVDSCWVVSAGLGLRADQLQQLSLTEAIGC